MTDAESIQEGRFTRKIERQTAKLQSANWLGLAIVCMAASAGAEVFFKRKAIGNFIGLWVPSLMLIGVYNKLVKIEANLERNQLH